MKRILSFLLALFAVIGLCACTKTCRNDYTTVKIGKEQVTVTFNASVNYLAAQDSQDENLPDCFDSVVTNADGSVTYTSNRENYDAMIEADITKLTEEIQSITDENASVASIRQSDDLITYDIMLSVDSIDFNAVEAALQLYLASTSIALYRGTSMDFEASFYSSNGVLLYTANGADIITTIMSSSN